MHITQLRLSDFRNFQSLELSPSPSFNLLYGLNGAGKSSVIEAIYLLGFGRSFRSSKADSIIKYESQSASSFCRFDDEGHLSSLGLMRIKNDGFSLSIDGEKTKRISDLARRLPIQIFTPQSSDLILGAPMLRRRFLDWLLFHVEQSFYFASQSYAHALRQRNALLKLSDVQDLQGFMDQDVWRDILIEHGMTINERRKHYLARLNKELKHLYSVFRPDVEIELRYNQGWDNALSLADAIHSKVHRDLLKGSSSVGPHKADIQFLVNGKAASEFLSRGQLRVLVSLLLTAQVKVLKSITKKSCIFLVDDIAAELDINTREFFLDTIASENAQIFVTAIEKEQLNFAKKYNNNKVFHVEHDSVNEE
ncbi:DNA replication/repair protein RecF [Ningiella sp. W23]|uniref:DNA replication/repair protein RecF n=1 Tax=Ningiella sp. W23 TaxID=3023715 RepID=UPI003756315D